MSIIGDLAEDLIEKIKTVPQLENRIGMATAGGASDPAMKTVPMPAAWLVYDGDSVFGEQARTPQIQDYLFNFSIEL